MPKSAPRKNNDLEALVKACFDQDFDTIKNLAGKIDLNQWDSVGNTCLIYAVSKGWLEIAEILLQNGASPNMAISYKDNTPLHLAVWGGDIKMVRLLLDHGANADIKNKEEQLPVDMAWREGPAASHCHCPDVVELLEKHKLSKAPKPKAPVENSQDPEDMGKTQLDLSREVQAISQSGLAFSKDPYDLIRYKQLTDIAAELIAVNSGHTKEFLNNIFSAETGYATPKLGTRVAVFRDDKILMVKESASGAWTLPGGYVDVNESLSASAEKEVFEESGFIVKCQKVAAIIDCRKHEYKPHLYHFYIIFVVCELKGGAAKTSIETTDVSFFSKAEIEDLNLDTVRITKKHILRMFDHHAQPALPVDFD